MWSLQGIERPDWEALSRRRPAREEEYLRLKVLTCMFPAL
jgi:hypothetical protein